MLDIANYIFMSYLCFIRYEILSVIKCTRKIIFCWHTSGVNTGTGEMLKVRIKKLFFAFYEFNCYLIHVFSVCCSSQRHLNLKVDLKMKT